jgi:hypothetical protein
LKLDVEQAQAARLGLVAGLEGRQAHLAEQLQQLVSIVDEALKARVEASRIGAQRVMQNAELASAAAKDEAAVYDTKASLLEDRLGLFLAQDYIDQMLGHRP